MMTQREVLMKIVARDVKYDSNVMEFVSKIPVTLTADERIARAIKVMIAEGVDNIPIVDAGGKVSAVLRSVDVINFLAEAFPEQLLNLPPEPNQTMPKPEGG
jgi:predicted transcriptional regulator